LFEKVLPEAFELAAGGNLKLETVNVKLENIADLWNTEVGDGKRLVITI
jgi:hypothetical protein